MVSQLQDHFSYQSHFKKVVSNKIPVSSVSQLLSAVHYKVWSSASGPEEARLSKMDMLPTIWMEHTPQRVQRYEREG